jgi:hypothetical protein
MSSERSGRCAWWLVAAAIISIAEGSPARALDPAADLEGFVPPLADPYGPVRGPRVPRHLDVVFGLHLRYAHAPTQTLRVPLHEGGSDIGTPIVDRLALRLGLGFGLFDRLEIDVALPIVLLQRSEPFTHAQVRAPMPLAEGAGLGDLVVSGKGLLVDDEHVALALALDVSAPTGRREILAGELGATLTPALLASFRAQPLEMVVGAGARLRTVNALLPDARPLGHEVRGSLAARVALTADVYVGAAAEGRLPLAPGEHGYGAFVEITGFVGGSLGEGPVTIGADGAVGAGLPRAYGSPWARGAAAIRAHLDFGLRDADGDGIRDGQDLCPAERETINGVDDGDGCPEPDRDGDGVPDAVDACPDVAVDEAGRQGCPGHLVDRDRDGIPDVRDRCPDEPEDTDGLDDEDGCFDEGEPSIDPNE